MNFKYDKQKLNDILKEFHNATGIRVSFLRSYNEPIMGYPITNCELCSLKQKDPKFHRQCLKDDERNFKIAENTTDFYGYECHYHLYECIQPVRINGEIFGYFLLGQILTSKNKMKTKNNLTNEELKLLNKMQEIPLVKVKSYAKILSWIAEYCIYSQNFSISYNEKFEKINNYILENYTSKITVESLCEKFHYSKSSLFSMFKIECGMGIIAYINFLRLQKSKELLMNYKPGIVCEMVGFTDLNYFSRLFKKTFGITPSQFKQQLKPLKY